MTDYEKELLNKIALIQAFLDGKTLEYRETKDDPWEPTPPFPALLVRDDSCHYRIKPEPKKLYAYKWNDQVLFFDSEEPETGKGIFCRTPEFDIEYKE